jgi:putative glutamine amidotransferase
MSISAPLIGIASDVSEPRPGRPRVEAALAYAACVRTAGGVPVLLAPIPDLIPDYLRLCQGFVFTGGDDPRMELFGKPTHAKATPMHPIRQAFDTALLGELLRDQHIPTLGVCLGMQMMALVAGGDLNQHLPDTLPTHESHAQNALHTVEVVGGSGGGVLAKSSQPVVSHHRQAVSDPGRLNVIATSTDGVIEAIADHSKKFFIGVQWHPERTGEGPLGQGVFDRLVQACR